MVEVWECRINRKLADNEDMKHYFDQYDGVHPLEHRDALYGGRTNASRLYHECNDDEKIRYGENISDVMNDVMFYYVMV